MFIFLLWFTIFNIFNSNGPGDLNIAASFRMNAAHRDFLHAAELICVYCLYTQRNINNKSSGTEVDPEGVRRSSW